jgi:hypothetical protein
MPENNKKDSGNLYTNIFKKKTKAEEQKPETTELVEGVMDKKAKEEKPEEKVLGPIPEVEKKIVGAFDPTKRNLKIAKFLFYIIIVISLVSIGFFYVELNPNFDLLAGVRGANPAQKLENTKQDILTVQTSINQKNYVLMASYLQKLSYLSDTYARARSVATPTDELEQMQEEILTAYENAQAKFREPIKAGKIKEQKFREELKEELRKEIRVLKNEEPSPSIIQEINTYSAALQLLNNKNLSGFFSKNTENIRMDLPQDDTQLLELTNESLEILENDFTDISEIKNNRIRWAVIVEEIERITKSIDTLYNTGFFEELGGIKYSAFDFDSETNQIILIGQAKRDDGSTFTLIANLIDALEQSELFYDVDNRTFPKSGSEEQGYTSSFRIELNLNEDYLTTL